MNNAARRWRAVYVWLLRWLPREFHERNAADLVAIFEERLGPGGRGSLVRECVDVIGLAFTLRLPRPGRTRSPAARGEASHTIVQELGQTVRGLLRAPTFSLSVLATMGFGLGTVSVVFTLAWGLWLSPLPYRDPDSLVSVADLYEGSGGAVSLPELAVYETAPAIQALAAYRYGALITNDPEVPPARLTAYSVEPRLFPILGVEPVLGRGFSSGDIGGSEAGAALISHRLWLRRFGGDPGIIGRSFSVSGGLLTIVGVMPAAFEFPYGLPSDVWLPLDRSESSDRNSRFYQTIGRLRPGAEIDDAATQLRSLGERLVLDHPETNRGWSAAIFSVVDLTVSRYRRALSLLLGLVALLAGVSVANTTSLFLARRLSRQRELSMRVALGATSWRLSRMVFLESAVLAAGAAAAGIAIAMFTAGSLAATLPASTPRLADVRVTWHSVAVVTGAGFLMALVCGMLSSLGIARGDTASMLRGAGRGVVGEVRHRLRSTLVVAEIALSVVLLVGAGITTRAFTNVMRADRGYDPQHLAIVHATVPFATSRDPAVRVAQWAAVRRQLAQLPGVTRVGMSTGFPGSPLGALLGGPFTDRDDPERPVSSSLVAADPDYFTAMRTPIRRGRAFTPADGVGAPKVAVVNEAFAKAMWPAAQALGRRLVAPGSDQADPGGTLEVVGVVADMSLGGIGSPTVYVSLAQRAPYWVDIMARTAGPPAPMIGLIEKAIREVEPRMLIEESTTMSAVLGNRFALERAQGALSVLFATLAVLLTAIGVYGLLASIIAQRDLEIGVRRALGASAAAIVTTLLQRGVTLGFLGVAVGAAIVIALRPVADRYLGGMTASVGAIGLGALAVLAIVAVACGAASRRALRIDALRVLR